MAQVPGTYMLEKAAAARRGQITLQCRQGKYGMRPARDLSTVPSRERRRERQNPVKMGFSTPYYFRTQASRVESLSQ